MTIEDWKREVRDRHKRRPREHQMSREEIELRDSSPNFQRCLDTGKSSERYVAEKLSDMGFTITDISLEEFEVRGMKLHSPFDLLASSQFFLFVADVKRRRFRVPIGIPVRKLDDYESYDKYGARDKLIIFHFPKQGQHQECFYMSIKDIRERCEIVGPFYHIEINQLAPISALRKTLENMAKSDV